MSTCTRIKNLLKIVILRGFMFPVFLLVTPFIFIVSDGDCEDGKNEVKDILLFIWNGME